MQKSMLYLVLCAALAALGSMGKPVSAEDAPQADDKAKAAAAAPAAPETAPKVPEFIKFDKVAKMPPVTFPHAKHGKMFPCEKCHAAKDPLFPQKHSEVGMKMADMKAGKVCGSCHDGKTEFGEGDAKKKIFASTMCMKCHKAAPKAEAKPDAGK